MVLAKNAAPDLLAKIEEGTHNQAELNELGQVAKVEASKVTKSTDVAPKRTAKKKN